MCCIYVTSLEANKIAAIIGQKVTSAYLHIGRGICGIAYLSSTCKNICYKGSVTKPKI